MKYLFLFFIAFGVFQASSQCNANVSAVLSGNPLNPNEVEFTNLSQAPVGSYFVLNTGDGNMYTLGQNVLPVSVLHTYPMSGTYTYCITIVDTISGCNDTFCADITISNSMIFCDAAFSGSDTLSSYTEIQFYSTGVNTGTVTHFWDFGNGTTSTQSDPSINFLVNGSYYVCHTVTEVGGQCSDTQCDSIVITNVPPVIQPCSSYFYWFEDSTTSQTVVMYNAASGNAQLNYFWDFGDGGTSTDPYPTHTYGNLGAYYVCLTVSENPFFGSCTSTFCDSVFVTFKAGGFTLNIYPAAVAELNHVTIDEGIEVYPNPASTELTISLADDAEIVTYEVWTVQGQKLIEGTLGSNHNTVSLVDLTEGVYLLRVKDHEPIKFIKSN